MKNQFVTYQIAKKIKELDFNETCLACFMYDNKTDKVIISFNCDEKSDGFLLYAPLWQQVIEYFAFEDIYIIPDIDDYDYYIIRDWNRIAVDTKITGKNNIDSREKAVLRAIDILKERLS